MENERSLFPRRLLVWGLFLLAVGSGHPSLQGQAALVSSATHADTVATQVPKLYPVLGGFRESVLIGSGGGMFVAGRTISVNNRLIPARGFDPSEIGWGVDRGIIGNRDVNAHELSNWTRNTAVLLPFALALIRRQSGAGTRDLVRRGLVSVEALLFSQGVSQLAKTAIGRPRPFAYLEPDLLPNDGAYQLSETRALRSLPSGHSATAWTGATLAMTEHLLTRPDAGLWERVGIGFVGGILAGSTSTLRVEAGQHFPSDVLAGAGVGMITGIAFPLLHRGEQPLPSPRAWMGTAGGALVGALVGIGVSR